MEIKTAFCTFWDSNYQADQCIITQPLLEIPGFTIKIVSDPTEAQLIVFSRFGDVEQVARLSHKCLKVFYTGECEQNDSRLNRRCFEICDYYIGFYPEEYVNHPDYEKKVKFEFPLGMLRFHEVEREIGAEAFRNIIESNSEKCSEPIRIPTCSLIASNPSPPRPQLIKMLSEMGIGVKCPGHVGNNHPWIGSGWQNKYNFMKSHAFNLCPENQKHNRYYTEKLTDALMTLTIPVYYGDCSYIEPYINMERPIFIEKDDLPNLRKAVVEISTLVDDPEAFKARWELPVFKKNAYSFIQEQKQAYSDFWKKVLEVVAAR